MRTGKSQSALATLAVLLATGVAVVAAAQEVLPRPDAALRRRDRAHARGVEAGLSRAAAAAGRRTERRTGADRRRRLRQSRDLRRTGRDADARSPRRTGPPLQPLPRDGAVLADASRAALRPQPPQRRFRHGVGSAQRLPGLRRALAAQRGVARGDPARQRLQHGRDRQVAPHARRPAGARGSLRSLAERARLRVLLGLPRRRGLALRLR